MYRYNQRSQLLDAHHHHHLPSASLLPRYWRLANATPPYPIPKGLRHPVHGRTVSAYPSMNHNSRTLVTSRCLLIRICKCLPFCLSGSSSQKSTPPLRRPSKYILYAGMTSYPIITHHTITRGEHTFIDKGAQLLVGHAAAAAAGVNHGVFLMHAPVVHRLDVLGVDVDEIVVLPFPPPSATY